MEDCDHKPHRLQPLSGWPGRYRCRCGIIGYKAMVLPTGTAANQTGKETKFVPYKCAYVFRKKRCGEDAVGRVRKVNYCALHAPERT